MHKSKLKGITLAVLLAFAPIAADAAGLGRLTVTSGLGEPLSAEIELLSPTPEELASLSAGIASPEAYSVQGVERTALHSAIKVDVTKRGDGTPILKLTTRQAVSDPFLDMLIQVDWETGRLLREYTVLLDPPGYNNQAQVYNGVQLPPDANAPSVAPPAARDAAASRANGSKTPARNTAKNTPRNNTVAPTPTPTPSAAASAPVSAASVAANDATGQSHTTVKGDTLSSIAQQHQIEGVSLDQMLLGLYRANEDAFNNKNMNRLKTGQIMRVPAASELQQVSPAEASREVRAHSSDWNAYRNRLAGLAAESTPAADGGAQQKASGRITSAATDKAEPADAGLRDVIKLSRSDAKGKAAAQEQINALQEELTAKDKHLAESSERLAALEKQISDMQKLLAIRNQSLTNLQNKEATATPAPQPVTPVPAQPTQAKETPKPEVVAESAKTEPTTAESASTNPASTDPAVATLAEPAPEASTETSKVQKPATPTLVPAPAVEEPSLIGEILGDDPLLPALAGGALVLLLGGWLFLRNKRKRELDSFEKGILTSGGLKANTVFGSTAAGATVNAGDTSFLTDFSPNTGGMIDTHDVDPIAEAEVYMAYGRDAQAEEILKDAIVKEPQRHELHVKLLEIYAARQDTSAFETVAGEIYTTLGAADPIWAKVAEMGRKLEPANPLYSAEVESKAVAAKASAPAEGFVSATAPESSLAPLAGAALAGAAAGLYAASSQEQGSEDRASDENAEADEFADNPFSDNSFEQHLLDADQQADLGAPEFGSAADSSAPELDSPEFSANTLEFSNPEDVDALPSLDFDLAGLGEGSAIATGAGADHNDIEFSLDLPEPPAKNTLQMDIAELDAEIPDFDLPELDAADEVTTLPDLDMPEFSFPEPAINDDLDTQAASPEFAAPDAESEPEVNLADNESSLPELTVPDFEVSEDFALPAGSAVEDVDLGLPEITLPEIELPVPGADEAESDGLADIDFDLPEITLGESNDADAASEAQEESAGTAAADNAAIEDFLAAESPAADDEPGVFDLSDLDVAADGKVETNDSVPHFNFEDIDLAGGESVSHVQSADDQEIELPDFDYPASETPVPMSVEIDISNINLNVADTDSGTTGLETGSLADESPDVDTKLDLVTAYMDMGDNEGARELLEEILKEGGPRQKEKAQGILDDLA